MKHLVQLLAIAILSMFFSGCFVAIGSSTDTVIQNNPNATQPTVTNPYYMGDF